MLVILLDNSYPLLKPSCNDCFNVKDPFADPIVLSFCLGKFGIKELTVSSYFNLFPDCEERWTVGVEFP